MMRTNLRITRIDLWSLFKVAFLLYAGIGVVVGLFYWFILMVAGSLGTVFAEEEIPGLGVLGGVLGVFLVPIMAFFYGAFSSVMITIGAALFNVAVRFTDGLSFEAEVDTETPPPAATTAPVSPTLPPAGPGDPI
jgi:hypothetical protein